jgi:hypothetical protein
MIPYFHTMKWLFCLFIVLPACLLAQNNDSVMVLPMSMAAPANAKKLGHARTGNNATAKHCDYEADISELKKKVKAMGGNLARITRLVEPAFISKCYAIEADIYSVDKLPSAPQKTNLENKAPISNNAPYALLCIYRLADTIAFSPSYPVRMGKDSVLCMVKSKSHDSVRIYTAGPVVLRAKNGVQQELKLDVKTGGVYDIRCGVIKGGIRMGPVLELVDEHIGATEFAQLTRSKKDVDISYLYQIH